MIDIQKDTGLFTAGLFEAGGKANGVFVQGVSEWVRPKQITDTLAEIKGQEVCFVEQPATVESAAQLGNRIAEELTQNMILVREFSYFGKGAERKQSESDRFLITGAKKTTWKEFAEKANWQW
jgi:hypothetical protein